MHRCLATEDILQLVFEELEEILENESEDGRAGNTWIELAVTCRAFQTFSFEWIWKNQSSLVPLLMTLPKHVWKIAVIEGERMDNEGSSDEDSETLRREFVRLLVLPKRQQQADAQTAAIRHSSGRLGLGKAASLRQTYQTTRA